MPKIMIYIPQELDDRLREKVYEEKRAGKYTSMSEVVRQALTAYLQKKGGSYPLDVKEGLKKYQVIPVLLKTINNKKLSEEDIVALTEKINEEY